MAEDTDTLLAILASLLPEPIPSHDILLDALVRAEGDIQAASQLLSSNPRASTVSVFLSTSPSKTGGLARGRKRKGLDSWLQTDNSPAKSRRTTSPERSLKPLSAGTIKPPSSTRPASTSSSNARSIYDVLHAPSRARSTSPSKTSSPTSHNALKPASSSSRPLSSSEKPRLNVNEALRPPPSTSHAPQRHPPLTLSTPALVAQHTPCTLHPSILPPKLASDVFHTMLAESKDWTRNKWYLFDRLVESPHSTAMYTRSGVGESEEVQDLHKVAAAWYNGAKKDLPRKFPEVVEEACRIVERAVNAEMAKRQRFPLEWAGVHPSDGGEKILWRANFCAANLYEGAKETVGFHSDRITSIGPYATIASISLGTTRTFRLREVIPVDEQDVRAARTFNIPLSHNSLLIMHGSTQERFKHAVPPQTVIDRFRPQFPPPPCLPALHVDPGNCRINITFRFYRPDFHPDDTPRCTCGEAATLRPDMKKRQRETADKGETERRGEGEFRYWWTCTAGDQNEGKTCGFWKVMDVRAEGRGPLVMDS